MPFTYLGCVAVALLVDVAVAEPVSATEQDVCRRVEGLLARVHLDDWLVVLRLLRHWVEHHVLLLLGNGQHVAQHTDLGVGVAQLVAHRVPGPEGGRLRGCRVFVLVGFGWVAGFFLDGSRCDWVRLGDGRLAEVDLGRTFGQVLGQGERTGRDLLF